MLIIAINAQSHSVDAILCAFIEIINTFRSLFKASDTLNVFQVLIKMADSHRNCQHH